jgi:hypothetical protein
MIMPIFVGLNAAQTASVTKDIAQARQLAMRAVNSMILTAKAAPGGSRDYTYGIRPAVAKLLYEAFCMNATQPDPDQVEKVKNVFFSFDGRMQGTTFTFVPGRAKPGVMEFEAFTDRTKPNTIFLRVEYFAKPTSERPLTLIHEYVHLVFSNNPGDGHPGGQQINFTRTAMGIPFADASRNPYCYEYYAHYLNDI